MKPWFEQWFSTDEYLEVYKHRNEKDGADLVDLIDSNIDLKAGSKILDMACGAGRHSILFAKKGYQVTAVDLSHNLLKVAKNNSIQSGLDILFIESDIRHFGTLEKFDLVVNLFTSFGYFESDEENFSLLLNAYSFMNDSGYFVLDFFNRNFIEKNLVEESVDNYSGSRIVQQRKIEGQRVVKRITIEKNGNQRVFFESVRMYSRDELILRLNKIGFEIIRLFGDFNGSKFDPNNSPRIIIIAGK